MDLYHYMPSFEEGSVYCFAAVSLSVSGLVGPVSVHFHHTEMKLSIQIYDKNI